MNILIPISLFLSLIFSQDLEYSMEDYNSTSPTYGMDVWYPEYSDYITLHYFSTQGWAGWTNTFVQLHNFQEELRADGYEKIVIIAVGQSVASNFNSNFCANSDLPLVVDVYPDYLIRDAFDGAHKEVVIIDSNQNELGRIILNNLNAASRDYIRSIIEENYEESIQGDLNDDEVANIQDIILMINIILNQSLQDNADLNGDSNVDILDVVLLVNIILQ